MPKLSEHFSLEEFLYSSTAKNKGIDNSLNLNNPNDLEIYKNLKYLCEEVLEPLRMYLDMPIKISSGYRCPKLNSAVGSASTSQHVKGEAADIEFNTNNMPYGKVAAWIIRHIENVDQVIIEKPPDGWIHVSCKRNGKNRKNLLYYNGNSYQLITPEDAEEENYG